MKKLLLAVPFMFALVACGPTPDRRSSREIEGQKQEELSKQAVLTVGMPAITNFAEKRMMKDILELRDKMQPTYTYTQDMNGRYHKVCDSLGYGLPYATQYTNPMERSGVPQADPNGLFSPASADGTWVMCLNPKTKKAEPQYVEPRITVLTFEMQ